MGMIHALSRALTALLQMASLDLHPGTRFGCLRSQQPLLERAAAENAVCVIVDILGKTKVLLEIRSADGYHLGSGEVDVADLTASELFSL